MVDARGSDRDPGGRHASGCGGGEMLWGIGGRVSMPHLVKELPLQFTGREAKIDTIEDLHAIARDWYASKIIAGDEPRIFVGGALDGLCYFEVRLGGRPYWMTGVGLFDPQY
jgi:hypothetical protein